MPFVKRKLKILFSLKSEIGKYGYERGRAMRLSLQKPMQKNFELEKN